MITLAQKKELLSHLERYAGGVSWRDRGICGNLYQDMPGFAYPNKDSDEPGRVFMWKLTEKAVRTWKNYSGVMEYPVRGGQAAYANAVRIDAVWSGLYGKCRYQLIDRLIAELKREMSRNHRSMRVSLKKKG